MQHAKRVNDNRGSNKDRAARKVRLLADRRFRLNGVCVCVHCSRPLDYDTVEADRIQPGGSYRYENVQPSCGPCNKQRGNNINWVGIRPLEGALANA